MLPFLLPLLEGLASTAGAVGSAVGSAGVAGGNLVGSVSAPVGQLISNVSQIPGQLIEGVTDSVGNWVGDAASAVKNHAVKAGENIWDGATGKDVLVKNSEGNVDVANTIYRGLGAYGAYKVGRHLGTGWRKRGSILAKMGGKQA